MTIPKNLTLEAQARWKAQIDRRLAECGQQKKALALEVAEKLGAPHDDEATTGTLSSDLSRFIGGNRGALVRWFESQPLRIVALAEALGVSVADLQGDLEHALHGRSQLARDAQWHPAWPHVPLGSVCVLPGVALDDDRTGAQPAKGGSDAPKTWVERVLQQLPSTKNGHLLVRVSGGSELGRGVAARGLVAAILDQQDPEDSGCLDGSDVYLAPDLRGGDTAGGAHGIRHTATVVVLNDEAPGLLKATASMDRRTGGVTLYARVQPWGLDHLREATAQLRAQEFITLSELGRIEAWLEAASSDRSLLGPDPRPSRLLWLLRYAADAVNLSTSREVSEAILQGEWAAAKGRAGDLASLLDDVGLDGLSRCLIPLFEQAARSDWWKLGSEWERALKPAVDTAARKAQQSIAQISRQLGSSSRKRDRQDLVGRLEGVIWSAPDASTVLRALRSGGLVGDDEDCTLTEPLFAYLLVAKARPTTLPPQVVRADDSVRCIDALISVGISAEQITPMLATAKETCPVDASRLVVRFACRTSASLSQQWVRDELVPAWAGLLYATAHRCGDKVLLYDAAWRSYGPGPTLRRDLALLGEASESLAGLLPDFCSDALSAELDAKVPVAVRVRVDRWTAFARGTLSEPGDGVQPGWPDGMGGTLARDAFVAIAAPCQVLPWRPSYFREWGSDKNWQAALIDRADAGDSRALAWVAGRAIGFSDVLDPHTEDPTALLKAFRTVVADPRATLMTGQVAMCDAWRSLAGAVRLRALAIDAGATRWDIVRLLCVWLEAEPAHHRTSTSFGSVALESARAVLSRASVVERAVLAAFMVQQQDHHRERGPNPLLTGWLQLCECIGDTVTVHTLHDLASQRVEQCAFLLSRDHGEEDRDYWKDSRGYTPDVRLDDDGWIERIKGLEGQVAECAEALHRLGAPEELRKRWVSGPDWRFNARSSATLRVHALLSRIHHVSWHAAQEVEVPEGLMANWPQHTSSLNKDVLLRNDASFVAQVGRSSSDRTPWLLKEACQPPEALTPAQRLGCVALYALFQGVAPALPRPALETWLRELASRAQFHGPFGLPAADTLQAYPRLLVEYHELCRVEACKRLLALGDQEPLRSFLNHKETADAPASRAFIEGAASGAVVDDWLRCQENGNSRLQLAYDFVEREGFQRARLYVLRLAARVPTVPDWVTTAVAGLPAGERRVWAISHSVHADAAHLLEAELRREARPRVRLAWAQKLNELRPATPLVVSAVERWASSRDACDAPYRTSYTEEGEPTHPAPILVRDALSLARTVASALPLGAPEPAQWAQSLLRTIVLRSIDEEAETARAKDRLAGQLMDWFLEVAPVSIIEQFATDLESAHRPAEDGNLPQWVALDIWRQEQRVVALIRDQVSTAANVGQGMLHLAMSRRLEHGDRTAVEQLAAGVIILLQTVPGAALDDLVWRLDLLAHYAPDRIVNLAEQAFQTADRARWLVEFAQLELCDPWRGGLDALVWHELEESPD